MNLPSKEECEGWDHTQVAFFMCKNNMQECASTVMRMKMHGQRLLNLYDSDLSKFSLIHQPQIQKIVQDIKKNDGSLLNKLRRLKSKPVPKVPARDYRDEDRESDDQLSDPDYDNDMYEDPRETQDDSYEPPPSERNLPQNLSASYPTGDYLDSCHNQPNRPPRKPLRPGKASQQLPPEPTHVGSDEEDYISPDGGNDDDNYIEPSESPPPNPVKHHGTRAGRDLPKLPAPLPDRSPSPDFYEVPDKENNSLAPPPNRACPSPLKPSPRVRRSPPPVQEPTCDDEYEVCDPDDNGRPPALPKPLPRERSPKPELRPKPPVKPKPFDTQTLPVMQTDQIVHPKTFSLDLKRPKIPLPHFTSLKPTDRGSFSADHGSSDEDMDICSKPWYASSCDRKTADEVLLRSNKDGAFMVRKSSGQDAQQPYTLVVFYKDRVYNIPIRFLTNTQQYALGRAKSGEEYFSSISQMIENYQRTPLRLIDTQSNTTDATKLCYPVTP